MKCPKCEHEFKLTWLMYWKSPLGRHTCPDCKSRFRMRHGVRYYSAVVGLVFFLVCIPYLAAIALGASGMTIAIITIAGIAVGLHFDKRFDDTWRGTIASK